VNQKSLKIYVKNIVAMNDVTVTTDALTSQNPSGFNNGSPDGETLYISDGPNGTGKLLFELCFPLTRCSGNGGTLNPFVPDVQFRDP
jgi:hypothetical protein